MKRAALYPTKLLRNEQGFGFAELTISTTILFLSILAFTSLMGTSLEYMGTTQAKTLGYNLATKAIEDLKDVNYSTVSSSGPETITSDGFTYTRTITVTPIDNSSPADGITDYKKITIDLSWEKPFSGAYSAVTYINPYGAVESVPSAPADIGSPDVQITAPASSGNIAGTVNVQATSHDLYGVTKVEIFIDDMLVKTQNQNPVNSGTFVASYSWNTSLYNDGIHNVMAKAYDAVGNVGVSQSIGYLVVNSPSTDNQKPTQPTSFNARRSYTLAGAPTTKIDLAWNASSDNIGVAWYKIEKYTLTGTFITSWYTTSLTSVDNVESTTATYKYRVAAIDGAGNNSLYSNWSIPDDQQSPSTPANTVILEKTGVLITFQWDASTDDGYVSYYNIYDNNVLYRTVSPTTPTVQTTVSYGGGAKDWSFTITAVDNAGRESNTSTAITWKSY